MQIDFDVAVDVSAVGLELTDQQADPYSDDEPAVVANANRLRLPRVAGERHAEGGR